MPATLQSPGEHQPLDNTMGAMLIGIIASSALYGISLVQTLYYYNRYRQDPWYLKAFVAVTVLLDTIHLAFIIHTIYYYLIVKYYDNEALNFMIWSVLAEAVPTGVTGTLVQFFYTIRVWRMSKKNYFLAGLILIIVFANTSCGTAWVIISLQRSTYAQLLQISGLTMSINALSAAADVLIAASLCILLHRSRTGFRKSDTMITKLILFVVNTGLVTSLCAVASLICLIASPHSLLYASFYFCIGRLYSNSLLAALNARNSIRGSSDDDHMMVSLPQTVISPSGTNISRNGRSQNISIRIDTTQEYAADRKLSTPMGDNSSSTVDELSPQKE